MKNLIIICLLFWGVNANGQDDSELRSGTSIKHLNIVQVKGLFGSIKTGIELDYKALYAVSSKFYLGWGVGVGSYDASARKMFVPITGELMGDLLEGKIVPFYSIGIGYGIGLPEEKQFAESSPGGVRFDAGFGIRAKGTEAQPYFKVGYNRQYASYPGVDDYGNVDKNVIYKRWTIVLGVIF
ncbi:MAG: hypothetical protein V3V14_10905 [Saprospiraceae bacterium]